MEACWLRPSSCPPTRSSLAAGGQKMPTEKQRGLGSAHQDGSPADSSSVLRRPAGTRTRTRGSAGALHHYRSAPSLPASAPASHFGHPEPCRSASHLRAAGAARLTGRLHASEKIPEKNINGAGRLTQITGKESEG